MAFQTIDGRDVFVVELKDFPPPMPINAGGSPELQPYAEALTAAITQGVVNKPGKYGIEVSASIRKWNVFEIIE
jgi:hypothetical protein